MVSISNHLSLFYNELILQTKAFQGDVFGSFVRDSQSRDICQEIDIRIEPCHLIPFINILSLKYDIISINHLKEFIPMFSYAYLVTFKNSFIFHPIKLTIHTIHKKLFKNTFSYFDVDLLVEDDSSLYIRNFPTNITFCIDKFSWIRDRILNKKFCIISNNTSLKEIAYVIEKAIHMVKSGWTMDDILLFDKSWIVAKWIDFYFKCNNLRSKYDTDKINKLKSCDECCLCQEKFSHNDIVINTLCNHNFHWQCPNNEKGLSTWVKNQNKNTCPFCRNTMFPDKT